MPGLVTRLRASAARRAERWLGSVGLVDPRPTPQPARAPEPEPEPEPVRAAEPPPDDDVVGSALSRAEVERVLDDLVRPALQSDGGDIELVDLVGGEVHVRLVGSCSSCPSSLVTMKMGVERLLGEELDGFERLVQVD